MSELEPTLAETMLLFFNKYPYWVGDKRFFEELEMVARHYIREELSKQL